MMERRLFVEKALRASLAAAFAPLAGCITPGSSTGTASHPGAATGSADSGSPSSSTGQTFPPATTPGVSTGTGTNTSTGTSTSTAPAGAINVKDYGAKGDGVTNDTDAFYAASQALSKVGGGTLWIPAGTYIVGKQTYNGPQTKYECWSPSPIIKIGNCQNPVVIQGETGSILKAAVGLRFGAFDPATGAPYNPPSLPFENMAYAGDAYTMIQVDNNADVTIGNLELDGNINGLILGGLWGDQGRQCDACGIVSMSSGKLNVHDVFTHHHGKDGIMVVHYNLTPDSPSCPVTLTNVVSDSNARQGLSWTGGNGLIATSCKFINTGTVRFDSAPAAGVDIEAENSVCRNGVFNNCEFANNHGCSVLADSGDSANITFNNCSIWGTKNWSVWANKPFMKFSGCNIHGSIVNLYDDPLTPGASVQFINCVIDDADSPTYGPVYLAHDTILIDMGGSYGPVTFDGCQITSMRGMSFYTNSNSQYPTVIKNTTITHGFPNTGNPRCLLQGVYLESVHFKENMPPTSVQAPMNIRDCIVGPSVVVDGPCVTWRWAPYTGLIPQGHTQG